MAYPSKIDHIETAKNRLLSQWSDKPNVQNMVKSLMQSMQEIEDALFQLLEERGIYAAIGKQLDILGLLIGVERGGRDDEDYRSELIKQTSINRSDGTADVISGIMEAATQTDNSEFWEHFPAVILFLVRGGYFPELKNILEGISQAGVRALLLFDDNDCFYPWEYLEKLELLIDNFLDAIEITDGSKGNTEYWSDPATLTGSGWVDNGGGSYTHSGTSSGEVRKAISSLTENKHYVISLTASGTGTFDLQLGGTPTNGFNSVTGLTAGNHTEVLIAESVSELNSARIISDSDDITVSNISVREAVLDNLAINIITTLVLPTNKSYLPEIQQVVDGTNLWVDPAPDSPRWVYDGDGGYSHFGPLSDLINCVGILEEGELYSVEFTLTSNAGISIFSLGPPGHEKNTVSDLYTGGVPKKFIFNLRAEGLEEQNAAIYSANISKTIENIKIKKAQVINPLCDIIETIG